MFTDDSAVSPVIGVILMVVITVILAAVIGLFVLSLGGSLQQNAPQANFGFVYEQSPAEVTITYEDGDAIQASRLNATASKDGFDYASSDTFDSKFSGEGVSTGDSATYEYAGSNSWDGATVRVVWESEDGENSATLSSSTAPN